MFKGLKNKIREETGNDVSQLSLPGAGRGVGQTVKGRHSRQGSSSSLGSFSLDGHHDGHDSSSPPTSAPTSTSAIIPESPTNSIEKNISPKETKLLEKKEEEWKKKLRKMEEEWRKKLEKKEEEMRLKLEERDRDWKKSLDAKERERKAVEEQRLAIEAEKKTLQAEIEQSEVIKKKYCVLQEEREQVDGFQTQEMSKLKHLLLAKEQDIASKVASLKESNAQIQALQSEVSRLRRYEEQLSTLQDEMESLRHCSENERGSLRSELAQKEEDLRHLKDRVALLERRTSADCIGLGAPLTLDERVQGLLGERALLERRLEEAHLHLKEIKSSWSSKIASLETQVGRLSRQAGEEGAERRRAEQECQQLEHRVRQLEEDLVKATEECERTSAQRDQLLAKADEQTKRLDQLDADLAAALRDKSELSEKVSEQEKSSKELIAERTAELDGLRQQVEALTAAQSALSAECASLREASGRASALEEEAAALRAQLAEAQGQADADRRRCDDMAQVLAKERRERDVTLMRNAEVSQQVELSRQQLRSQESEMTDLHTRVETLEKLVSEKDKSLEEARKETEKISCQLQDVERDQAAQSSSREHKLKESLAEMETQLLEKDKSIRVLQQRLGDMKKTLQRELRSNATSNDDCSAGGAVVGGTSAFANAVNAASGSAAVLAPSSSHQISQRKLQQQATGAGGTSDDNNVNFQYLKHVLMKFLTSREYEAKHLTRAVATLLHFSPEEERLLRETLEWKMSWFGSKPNLGFGQTAKTIPPS